MTPRLASGILVSALIRAVETAGGHGMVLAKGDREAGAILLIAIDRGRAIGLRERSLGHDDRYVWRPAGPAHADDPATLDEYIARRRHADPDQWIVELDHADALNIAEAMFG